MKLITCYAVLMVLILYAMGIVAYHAATRADRCPEYSCGRR